MDLLDGLLLYFLLGSAASASSGKNKSVEQLRKESVEFSNGSWNDILRRELRTIDTYDCRRQLSLVQKFINNAREKARFYHGSFVMDSDVRERYQKLLAEHQRQTESRLLREKEKQQPKEQKKIEQEKNAIEKKQDIEKKEDAVIQYTKDLLEKSGFAQVNIRISKNKRTINISALAEKGNKISMLFGCDTFIVNDEMYMFAISDFIDAYKCFLDGNQRTSFEEYFISNGYSFNKFYYTGGKIRGYVTKKSVKYSVQFSDWEYEEKVSVTETEKSKTDTSLISSDRVDIAEPSIDYDNMDGWQFERFCAEILEKNGYNDVTVTNGSGDQGVDVIAYRDGIKCGIQCKCYSSDIGNEAVQEVNAGKTFYNCHVGIILTNRFFTPAAIELAKTSGIILWDRNKLLELIKQAGIT